MDEIAQVFSHAVIFNVTVRVSSRRVTFADLPFTPVVVTGGHVAGQTLKQQ